MKTVICCINSKYIHSSLAPWYLLVGIHTYSTTNIQAEVLEFTINQPPAQVADLLAQEKADVYCFCSYIWNIEFLKDVLPLLKQRVANCKIVLGGPEVSFRPQSVFKDFEQVDFVISGEGEESLPKLLDAISLGKDTKIAGISYLENGTIIVNPAQPLQFLPPDPYCTAYFASLNGRIAYIEGSRGCPFSCSFCLSGREDKLRLFPIDRVKEDILKLANTHVKTIKFVDRTFNCHLPRCKEIISFIMAEYGNRIPVDVCFHFEVAADLFDAETIALLSKAPKGLFQLEAGLQSFHKETLEAVTRKTDMHKLCSNLQQLLNPQNIHLHIDLIAGLPYEDIEIFKHSFNQAFALHPHMLQLGFLKLLYGSRLRAQIEQNGFQYNTKAPYEVKSTNWLSEQDMLRLHRLEDVNERLYNSGRFDLTVSYLLQITSLTPFNLFDGFAQWLYDTNKKVTHVSLDEYTAYVLDYFSALDNVDKDRLWDTLVCDALSSRQLNRLPSCLFVKDPRVAKITRLLKQTKNDHIKRGIWVLRAQKDRIAVVEYTNRDPVTGRYSVDFMPLSQFDI